MVKAWVLTALMAAAPVVASAQQPPRAPDSDTIRARQKISLIEGLFERAVQNGVDNFSRQLQAVVPNAEGMAMLMGAPLVRGFRLERVGIFFDVQMPSLQLSMVWPLRYSQGLDAAMASLADVRASLERTDLDPQTRVQLTQKIRQIEVMAAGSPLRRRGGGATAVSARTAGPSAASPAPSPVDSGILDDPAEAWRREVRSTLTDAMIENTGGVTVGPDEYLYVAARGVLSSDRLVADPADTRTIELRLKGSDLAAFRAGTITLEDARKRVEVREY